MKGYLMTSLLLAGIAALASHVEGGHRKLSAPTYYIATRADYTGDPARIHVRGASNLPAGARLSISIYDRVGQGSTLLSDETVATVDGEGFFEVAVHAAKGSSFRHNVCDVVFMPRFHQPASIFEAVGEEGERLGFPQNPQAYVHSGEYYLLDSVHVP